LNIFVLDQKKLIEAALFMSPKPLAVSQLMEITESQDYTQTKRLALEMLGEFNSRDSALEIIQVEDKFQMMVRQGFNEKVSRLASEALFHKGMMKTLALIAFRQPITQAAVIKHRNTKAYDHIASLLEGGFISRDAKGRTFVLRTTKKFLEHFGGSMKSYGPKV